MHGAVSDDPELTTDGQATDVCNTTAALLTKSSRAQIETLNCFANDSNAFVIHKDLKN